MINALVIDWSHILASAIGTILGGLITIAALYIKERLDRRGVAQAWYERYYIDEGTDRLLAHLKIIHLQLSTCYNTSKLIELRGENVPAQIPETLVRSEANEPVPIESIVRLETLLKTSYLTIGIQVTAPFIIYPRIPPQHRSLTMLEQVISYSSTLYNAVEDLRNKLLTVRIARKSDIYRIQSDAKIAASLQALKKVNQEWLAGAAERSRQVREGK